MRRDILFGTAVGLTIGIVAYITSKPKPKPNAPVAIQIDPAVYRVANPDYKHPTRPVIDIFKAPTQSSYRAPYEVFGFGMDSSRNSDSIDPDSYLAMPLESDGISYKNRDKYTNLEEEPEVLEKKYKFIRFTVLETRSADEVAIGGIRFLRNGTRITNVVLWNPHTGDKNPYNEEEWIDSDQWSAVFVFSEPVAVTEYQIKTSSKSPEMDPTEWKLEGSTNASFWDEIHTISSRLPFDRGVVVSIGAKV